jgi:hypothetical protein
VEEWLITYESYTDVELTAEVTSLKTQASNPYNAQTEGNRSYARSTTEVRTRLAAAIQIQRSRGNESTFVRHGVADFSNVRP